ncbi:MAG: hypothetical protein COB24_12975 [Hyphomicrobiales bacterium]|nr:MAG: hypothetical protein COB24_12975 [Hyphomicrobiales bacterium]
MNKYVYIQNHKLEYLAGFELGLPKWVSRMSSAWNFDFQKNTKTIIKNYGLSDVWITTMNHIK